MENQFERTQSLIGADNLEKLKSSRVAVFGVGGVGGYTVEALARCGIGFIDLIDNDTVSVSNINRQIIALHSTVGMKKVDVAKKRIADINPDATVNAIDVFYSDETAHQFDFSKYDYIVDAIDTVSAKVKLAIEADKTNTPIISCMGTGNKLEAAQFEVSDINKTSVCPLARVMRKLLKENNVKKLKVVYSKEQPASINLNTDKGKAIPASIPFVPATAGMIIAGEVIKDLIK